MAKQAERSFCAAACAASQSVIFFGLAVFAVAIVTRVAHLDRPPSYDEFYHLLAGASWANEGSFNILDGAYLRTPIYTILTGWILEYAGTGNVVAARAPNVIFGAALAAATAAWTRSNVGALAGWIVAFCVILWPSGIHLSQIVRFYAIHGLLFFIGAVALYDMFSHHGKTFRRVLMFGVAIAAFWLSYQFQASTLVGVAALSAWLFCFVLFPKILIHRRGKQFLSFGAFAVILLAVFASFTPVAEALWTKYTFSPWGRDPSAYHRVLRETYPLLWPVTPILAIFAVRESPRPAWFCITLVVVGLVLHSLAGLQNIRYIYYFTPFLFILWALGLQSIFSALWSGLNQALDTGLDGFASRGFKRVMVTLVLIFAVGSNAATTRSIKLIIGNVAPPLTPGSDWSPARRYFEGITEEGGIVVVSNDLAATYYLGGFDIVFSRNWLPIMETTEFARDPRTGRRLISRIESLEGIVQNFPRGAFLASASWWSGWPSNNSVPSLLRAFEGQNVLLEIEQAGPIWILQWTTSEVPHADYDSRIRSLINNDQ